MDVDITDNKLAKKIREAQLEQCVPAAAFACLLLRRLLMRLAVRGWRFVTRRCRYNYILVVGEEERCSNTVNCRTRDNVVHGTKTIDEIIAEFKTMADSYQA